MNVWGMDLAVITMHLVITMMVDTNVNAIAGLRAMEHIVMVCKQHSV